MLAHTFQSSSLSEHAVQATATAVRVVDPVAKVPPVTQGRGTKATTTQEDRAVTAEMLAVVAVLAVAVVALVAVDRLAARVVKLEELIILLDKEISSMQTTPYVKPFTTDRDVNEPNLIDIYKGEYPP